jgi:hypothetical protein
VHLHLQCMLIGYDLQWRRFQFLEMLCDLTLFAADFLHFPVANSAGCRWSSSHVCCGGWMNRRWYGIYHGILVHTYHSIYYGIYHWYMQQYIMNGICYKPYSIWYILYTIYLGIYHTLYTIIYIMVCCMLYSIELIIWYLPL